MRKYSAFIAFALVAILSFTGFQCSSTEMTSAKLYIQQKNYEKALEVLTKEVTKNPKSDEGYYYMGVVYIEMEKYDDMLGAFDKCLAISQKYTADVNNAKKKAWVDSFNKGVGFYNKAANTKNADSSAMFYDRAIEIFDQATRIAPDSADAYKNLVLIHFNRKNYDAAEGPLLQIIKLEPNADSFKYLAAIYNDRANTYKTAYEKSKNEADNQKYLDVVKKSVEILEKGVELFPNELDLYTTLIEDYDKLGQNEKGLEKIAKAVNDNPTNETYRYIYGYVLFKGNNYEQAIKQFEEAEKIKADFSDAIYNTAVSYLNWGLLIRKAADEKNETTGDMGKSQFNSSLAACERLLKVADKEPKYWELYAKINSVLGNTKAAEDAFKKADELRTKK
ncbi:MAG: tetratricopeptide repeat protein [Ignavibacteriaceae bacterium]|nr:tetratricopeptide repeat protein [Ignavibacteriaceae bacterium]